MRATPLGGKAMTDCPSHEALAAYVARRLPSESSQSIATHVAICSACDEKLRDIYRAHPSLTASERNDERARGAAVGPGAAGELLLSGARTFERKSDADLSEHTTDRLDKTVEIREQPSIRQESDRPKCIGPYELLERIGEGGMGVVYKARDIRLNRLVAVKMMSVGRQGNTSSLKRFQREGEAIARLKHPNVAPVYELAVYEGIPYLVMEYAQGGTLKDRLAAGPIDEAEAADWMSDLAAAVQAAHDASVLHRDLKPSNVLLAGDGSVRLADFGLARFLDDEQRTQTLSNEVLGTPSYMAPEQAEGRVHDIGRSTDVYGLGAIFFELLTGRPPFTAATPMQTLDQVRKQPPPRPSSLRPGLSRRLEDICLKCLEKRPAHRYASAAALAADLARWRDGRSTSASLSRWRRAVTRRPLRIAVLITLLLSAIAAPVAARKLDPQAPIKAIERRLTGGEPATLVGPTGGPAWSRWTVGAGRSRTFLAGDGAFTFHADDIALLELLPDPQCTRYVLEGEIWHQFSRGGTVNEVGLYFAHREFPASGGKMHSFCHVAFDELEDMVARARSVKASLGEKGGGVKIPPGNHAVLVPHFLFEGDDGRLRSDRSGQTLVSYFPRNPGGAWRRFRVTVTPEQIGVHWDGKPTPRMIAVASLVHGKSTMIDRMRLVKHDPRYGPAVEAGFATRGSLGLYVVASSAAFRNVRVIPMAR